MATSSCLPQRKPERRSSPRRAAAVIVIGTLFALSGCDTSPSSGDSGSGSEHRYTVDADASVKDSPIWAEADARAILRIGVPFDQPRLGFLSAQQTVPSGFDADIGRIVAGRLGFAGHQIMWVDSSAEPLKLLAGDSPAIDILIDTADQPITGIEPKLHLDSPLPQTPEASLSDPAASPHTTAEPAPEAVAGSVPEDLAGPFFTGGQALLLPVGGEISGFDDLGQSKVCAVSGSAGRRVLEQTQAQLVERATLGDCAGTLGAGDVAAVVGSDAELRAMAAQDQQALTVSTDVREPGGYWVRLRQNDPALSQAITRGLAAAVDDGDWEQAAESAFGADAEVSAPPES